MADFINYGDLQVDSNALLTALADNIPEYLNSKPWSKKKKQRFLDAYSDIVANGINGADTSSGRWGLNIKGTIDLESKSKKDLEAYHLAARFILKLMKGNASAKKEETPKDLPLFDNKEFTNTFTGFISNDMFGGRNIDMSRHWDTLDVRDKNGMLSTDKRMAKLADLLLRYSNTILDGKYSFEGGPFSDLNDFKSRIDTAIQSLKNGVVDDNVKQSLNRLGLDWEYYLHDGSNETVQLPDGTTMTRGDYVKALLEQEANLLAIRLKEEQAAAFAARLANKGVLKTVNGIHAYEAKTPDYINLAASQYGVGQQGFNNMDSAVKSLLEKSYSGGGLTNSEKRQLGNLLYYIRTNNPNYKLYGFGTGTNMTDAEWKELSLHKNLPSLNKNDYIRLPWQTSDGRYTFADNKGNVYFLKTANHKKFDGVPLVDRQRINLYKLNFLKTNLQINNDKPVLDLDKDILISDGLSMLGDIVSLGGGVAGAAGGITTLISDLYGDIRRGKNITSVLKNLGANIAWGAAGLIPGAKLAKVAKTAARVYAGIQSLGIIKDPEVQQSWENLINGKDLTARDFENLKWTLHAITGGTNAIRGHYTERNVEKLVKKPTVETKSGKKVSITREQVKKINKAGARKGLKAAQEEFKKATGEEAKEGSFNFSEEGRGRFNPNRYSRRLRNWTSDDEVLKPETAVDLAAIERLSAIDKEKPFIGIGNPFNKRFWNEGGPNRGGLSWALSPYKNGRVVEVDESEGHAESGKTPYTTPKTGKRPVESSEKPNTSFSETAINRAVMKRYKDVMDGKFSKKEMTSGNDVNIGSEKVSVYRTTDSSGKDLITIGTSKGKLRFTSMNEAKKFIAKIVKELNKSILKSSGKKIDTKEMGKVLQDLKRKGWLKLGGTINSNLDTIISNFLNNLK